MKKRVSENLNGACRFYEKDDLESGRCILMNLWKNYAEKYRTAIEKYHSLLEEKRVRKLALNKLTKDIMESYPSCPFFDIKTEEEAEEFLNKLTGKDIWIQIGKCHYAIEHRSFKSLSAFINNSTQQIIQDDYKKQRARLLAQEKAELKDASRYGFFQAAH